MKVMRFRQRMPLVIALWPSLRTQSHARAQRIPNHRNSFTSENDAGRVWFTSQPWCLSFPVLKRGDSNPQRVCHHDRGSAAAPTPPQSRRIWSTRRPPASPSPPTTWRHLAPAAGERREAGERRLPWQLENAPAMSITTRSLKGPLWQTFLL